MKIKSYVVGKDKSLQLLGVSNFKPLLTCKKRRLRTGYPLPADMDEEKMALLMEYMACPHEAVFPDNYLGRGPSIHDGALLVEGVRFVELEGTDIMTKVLIWAAVFAVYHQTFPAANKGGNFALFLTQNIFRKNMDKVMHKRVSKRISMLEMAKDK